MNADQTGSRRKMHWEDLHAKSAPGGLNWYRPHLETSLRLIESALGSTAETESAILDAGGGQSTLVDDLLERGYRHLTVCDVSEIALVRARERLGDAAARVEWQVGDVLTVPLPEGFFDLWHDRAVFHFLTEPADREAYVRRMAGALKPGGHVVMATFGLEGPTKCSSLEVCRYGAAALADTLGARFRLVESLTELHTTPVGNEQQFLYCHFVSA